MKFDINVEFGSLEDFIYKRQISPSSSQISFNRLSKLAHTSHASITRRYRKFLAFKRSDDVIINKRRAKHCCSMVRKHLHDLKEIQVYINQNGLRDKHPVFGNRIDKWINQCERIYHHYKHHIKEL